MKSGSNWLGLIGVGLGLLALVVALGGRFGSPVTIQFPNGGPMMGQTQRGTPRDFVVPNAPQAPQAPQVQPAPQAPGHGEWAQRGPHGFEGGSHSWRDVGPSHGMGRGHHGGFFMPFFMGGLFRFAVALGLIALGWRLLKRGGSSGGNGGGTPPEGPRTSEPAQL